MLLSSQKCIPKKIFYDTTIKTYAQKDFVQEYARRLYPSRRDPIQQGINRFAAQLQPKARILDLGCGTGKDVHYLRSKNLHAEGIDISREMINYACQTVGNYFSVADLREIYCFQNKYDGIISLAVLQHIHRADLKNVIRRIRNLLAPRGIFFLLTKEGSGDCWDKRFGPHNKRATTFFSQSELTETLNLNDFEIVDLQSFSLRREGKCDSWISILSKLSARPSHIKD